MTGEFDEGVEGENTDRSQINFGRGSQVVRHGSAKAVFVGSIPTLASKISDFFARTKTTGEVPVSL